MTAEPLYPPEPWHLGGSMHVSLWRVPVGDLPASLHAALPTGARIATVAGTALVGTAFVHYEPGSVLSYDELLVATLVRHGRGLRITISDIWVDSPASVAGGRELWGIPKRLADFERGGTRRGSLQVRAIEDGVTLAELQVVPGVRVPGWRRLPMPTTQRLDGVETVSRVQSLARVRFARAAWRFPAGSPIAWLQDRRPIVTTSFEELAITFGTAGGPRRR
ncbi:MAG: acetoacetate decarboxylase family protein [Nitriliruptor sp.]|uniref:acetoacetate decarboxylase family protein n=1 Tax=Nitriliruptor sp. TaxID=2448056 RepID=UPI0034A077B6